MKWAEPELRLVTQVACNLREEDQHEVALSDGLSGYDAVMLSYAESCFARVILGDDSSPVGVTGLCGDRIWLLGTPELMSTRSHRWQLAVHGREWVETCLRRVNRPIGNHAYAKNAAALRWLKHLGFTVMPPAPFGPCAALFCEFWRAPR